MQPGGAIFSEPAPLPPPTVVERLMLESGVWTGLAVALAGGLITLLLVRQGKARPAMLSAAGAIALATGFGLLSTIIETDRERISARARALVAAARERDPAAASALVHESVRVVVAGESVDGLDQPALLNLIEQVPIAQLALLENQAAVEGAGAGVSQLQLRASVGSVPSLSWWKLSWRLDDADAWVVVAIEPILINGRSPRGWLANEMRSLSR